MHQRIGPGLLEVPEESNGRGLREVGCLPGARPGPEPTDAGRGSAADQGRPRRARARRAAARQRRPGPHPSRTPTAGARRSPASSSSRSPPSRTSPPGSPNIVIPAETYAEKEGTVTHPDGRLQRLRRNVPLPEGMTPGWRFLAARRRRSSASTSTPRQPADVFDALSAEVPFYDGADLRGDRRHGPALGATGIPGQSLDAAGARSAERRCSSPAARRRRAADGRGAACSGTYRDLWAADVTKRNPALRFLMPKQKLELAAKDAEQLELANGDEVTVSVNGHSVEATRRDPRADAAGRRVPDRGHRRGQRATCSPTASRSGSR